MVFEIIFFSTDSGKQPVKEFLDELDVKMRNKILDNLKHLQIHGMFLGFLNSGQDGEMILRACCISSLRKRG